MADNNIVSIISEPNTGFLLLSVLILLLSALILGRLATLIRLPKVAGEILGGVVVGPTLFGRLFPEAYEDIFFHFSEQGSALSVFYWLGLIFLMFSSGYESNMKDYKDDKKVIGWLIAGATLIPMLFGYLVSEYYFADYYLGKAGNRFVFNMIFAIAIAVTSLPVISKIFMDLGLMNHRFARIILTAATLQDLFLWVILSVATSIITRGEIIISDIILHIIITLSMFAFAIIVAPRLKNNRALDKLTIFSYDSIVFIVCFFFIFIGGVFGVNVMYSAFVAGLVFKNIRRDEAVRAHSKLKDICLAFFTPVYFAIVGLRIHITGDFSASRFLAFLLIASFLELFGCIVAMKLIKIDWITSFNLGVAMNARGGPGIVLATVTYDMGIINYEFFCALIFVVLITSTAAGYWIGYINKKGKLLTI